MARRLEWKDHEDDEDDDGNDDDGGWNRSYSLLPEGAVLFQEGLQEGLVSLQAFELHHSLEVGLRAVRHQRLVRLHQRLLHARQESPSTDEDEEHEGVEHDAPEA